MQSITNNFGGQVHDLKQTYGNQQVGPHVAVAAHDKSDVRRTDETPAADKQKLNLKEQLNQSILQSNLDVNISAGNEPMALLFKTAIDGINDVLGENAIQSAYDTGVDVSPEATAERIVSMSTSFFSSYMEQHPELSAEEGAESFAEVITSGINQGFKEAREILEGLSVLDGDIASNIDKTYELVQQGVQAFVDAYTQPAEGEQKVEVAVEPQAE